MAVVSHRSARPTSVPFAARAIVLAAVLVFPILVVGHGHLPADDALRHAAKAVSGRAWDEILVLRPDMAGDAHPGWHALLTGLHALAATSAHSLVLFSVASLFLAFSLGPALSLRRPEAWLFALLVLAVADPAVLSRLLQGRPLLVSAAAVTVLCLLHPRLREEKPPWGPIAALTVIFAAATWMHGSWYLFALPVACVFLAGARQAGWRLVATLAVGIAVGALLSGEPFRVLIQAVRHAILALRTPEPSTLAVEFQPFSGSPLMVVAVAGMLGWRALRGAWQQQTVRNPTFLLAALGWVLGFVAVRFWSDWGVPAALVWMAREMEEFLEAQQPLASPRRLATLAAFGTAAGLAISSDVGGRYGAVRPDRSWLSLYLSAEEPAHAPWLPDPGGVLYSTEMRLFYRTFYKNPTAPWRYVLGFEPGLMPPEDLSVYRAYMTGGGDATPLLAWVDRMRMVDRLFVVHHSDQPPPLPRLEWHQVLRGLWSGRLPRGPASSS